MNGARETELLSAEGGEGEKMENQQVIELIRRELPGVLQRHPDMRDWVIRLTRDQYADKQETESRFDRVLNELRREREENTRKWEEQNRKWEEQNRKWEKQNRKWEEQNHKWEEQNRKWDANQQMLNDILETIKAQAQKHESSIGALGARWGLYSEASFRNGLKAILEKSFGVEVLNINEYDEAGEVFGHPDQVELDVIILDGTLILCELKSSISKSDMYAFEKKTVFYEKRHNRKASRKLVISPMVDDRAKQVAQRLGIEVYTHADDMKPAC